MNHASFAELLKSHIESCGLSYSGLAAAADGLDHAYIYRLARGERPPASRNVVLCLAIAMRLTVPETDELLEAAGLMPVSDRRGRRREAVAAASLPA